MLELIGRGFPNKRIALELGIVREDGQDARRPRARQARRHRPHAGGAARGRARGRSSPTASGPRTNCPWQLGTARALRVAACRSAIITGASRGLGLALARALAERGWALVVDARGAAALERCGRRARASPTSSRSPATSPTTGTAARSSRPRASAIDLLVNNASLLGPSPQPTLADYPARRARARLPRSTSSRRSRSSSSPCRVCADGRRDRQRHLRRGRRALRRAGAATAPRRPRSSS